MSTRFGVNTESSFNNDTRKAIEALQNALPDDGVATLDVGIFKLVFLQQWRVGASQRLLVANGLSAMGYAVPAAIAASLEHPKKKIAAVAGDGALLMYAGELASLSRLGGSIVVLVIVNEALSLIRLKQLRMNLPVYGTEFLPTNYRALAKSFGLEYRLITSGSKAEDILDDAFALNHPVLVEVRVDKDEYDRFR